MSYILDALRRADAERERGSVPGLHAQLPTTDDDEPHSPRAMPSWVWFAGGVALVIAVGIVWQGVGHDVSAPSAPPASPTSPAPAQPAATVAMAPVPTPLPVNSPPAATPPVTPLVVPAAALPSSAAMGRPASVSASAARTAASTASPAASGAERIYAQNELPDNIRRALPALSIGGSIYSDNAASRFLIINGQIFHEGDKVAPDLALDQIKLKAAVLRFKGYRYSISF